jgi:hypothetical protein
VGNRFQTSRRWRRMGWPGWLLVAGFVIGLGRHAAAHDLFTNYVQHSVQLTVGARCLDLILDLTFFEAWSARERQAMDANADGHITRSELTAYLKKLAPELCRQIKLRVGGREVPLVPLYDPEVDLLANDQTGPGHHRLRLFFFAPTPTALQAGEEIIVEDRLWPEAKVLGTVQAEGRDGCTLTTEISINPDFASVRPDDARWFKFRCLKPPASARTPKTSSARSLKPAPAPRTRSQLAPSHPAQTVL